MRKTIAIKFAGGEITHPKCGRKLHPALKGGTVFDLAERTGRIYIQDPRSEHLGRFDCCAVCKQAL